MTSLYPGALDTTTQLPNTRADATTTATQHVADHNNLSDAVRAIEGELGINPKGSYASVVARLNEAVMSTVVDSVVTISQADYDALGAPDGTTLYLVLATAGTTYLVEDTFTRSVTDGLGTAAPTGLAWATGGTAADFDVVTDHATIVSATGTDRFARQAISALEQNIYMEASVASVPTAGAYSIFAMPRMSNTTGTGSYRGRVTINPSGVVKAHVQKISTGGTVTDLTTETTVSGITYTANMKLKIRCQATGTPTTLRIRVWKDGDAEPGTWFSTATGDTETGLQVAGGTGFYVRCGSGSTPTPATFSVDYFSVE